MKELNKDISIIIVLYQEEFELLEKCLENINGYKFIIIDNDGNKELKKKIEEKFFIYKYILNKKNIGFSKAANKAIDLVDTPYILNLQADCEIFNSDIEKMYSSYKEYKDCFLVSPTFFENDKETFNSASLPEKKMSQKILKIEGNICTDTVIGSVIFFQKKKFIKLGGFDENFFLYFVDYDLCRRIIANKKSIIQLHDVKVRHEHGNIKIKNKIKKIFIRNYHFTYDELYYYYKINKHHEKFQYLKKKIIKYIFKAIINCFSLRINQCVYYFAKIIAYYKFKKLLNQKH